jgi:hypothetical protein
MKFLLLAVVGSISASKLEYSSLRDRIRNAEQHKLTQVAARRNYETQAAIKHFIMAQQQDKKYRQTLAEARAMKDGLWELGHKYSDELCDGDADDDKELEDEEDPNDPIVADVGFGVHMYIPPTDPRLPEWNWDFKKNGVQMAG